MTRMLVLALLVLAAATALMLAASAVGASAAPMPASFQNCAAVNVRYPNGIGKAGARDRTSGEPVTTFFPSSALYARAMAANRGLDRDHDGIACEKQ